MSTFLRRMAKKGYTAADIRGMYVAGQLLKGNNIGPQMEAVLQRYGLEELAPWVGGAIVNNKSQEEILLELHDQPAFLKRFPAIRAREEAGLPPISVDDYLNYESIVSSLGSTWGLQLSKDEVDNLLIHDVSAQEVEQRFNIAASAVFDSDIETRTALQSLFGVTTDQLMRYWMNPKEQLGVLQGQFRQGQIAGAALRTGFGPIDLTAAARLQETGMDQEQALQGFSQLAHMQQLFSPISLGERAFTDEDQIEFLAGEVGVARAIEQQARRRVAAFRGQAGFGAGTEGFTTGQAVRA